MRERGLEWIPLDDALIAYAVWNARTGAPIAEQPCRKNEPFAVSETTLACVHPETRELTLYELPVV
ncbi:MAG: hypothetical protein H6722_29685 [Sandaracinus sp.]|nr:hypothetical protein [Sandaracinus sp.]